MSSNKIKLFLLCLLMLTSINTKAYDFVVDGIYYNILSDNQVEITYKVYGNEHHTYSGILIIPESVSYNGILYNVTSIGDYAFYNCNVTGNIVLPNSVTTIGNLAFYNCSGLTGALTIPNSVKTIKYGAFMSCSGLLGPLTIPNSVEEIGAYAFQDCSNISYVYSKITNPFKINNDVFKGISSDAILHIPIGTQSLYQAFSGGLNISRK